MITPDEPVTVTNVKSTPDLPENKLKNPGNESNPDQKADSPNHKKPIKPIQKDDV